MCRIKFRINPKKPRFKYPRRRGQGRTTKTSHRAYNNNNNNGYEIAICRRRRPGKEPETRNHYWRTDNNSSYL